MDRGGEEVERKSMECAKTVNRITYYLVLHLYSGPGT